MNDRAVSVLENYELEVIRSWKGRGALLCETNRGLLILKEYPGLLDKLVFQDALLNKIKQNGFEKVESILKTKEGELVVYDQDQVPYILKTYFEGRECNVRDEQECVRAIQTLARLHKASDIEGGEGCFIHPEIKLEKEYEKHNKELRKVRKFLKEKSQKSNFELYLLKNYDYFYNIALQITEEVRFFLREDPERESDLYVCHGDFQYHNILVTDEDMALINFEKCMIGHPVKDLYLFMRKLMEKSNWSWELGNMLITAYNEEKPMSSQDFAQLYYRFCYPEKFWKIVNFYYNSGKAWIPGRNLEKLEKLLAQEHDKQAYLENYKSSYGRFSFM